MTSDTPKRRPSDAPPIAEELVFELCDALKREGEPVTNDAVRRRLGGGSFITIAPLVRAWKEKEDQRYRISQFEIPDKVEEAAQLAAKEIWRAASEIASMELLELGRKLSEAESQHQSSAKEYEVEILRLESEGQALSEKFAADAHEAASRIQFLEAQVKSLETSLSEKTRDFELSQAKLTDSQARVGELTNHINARDKDLSMKERELQKALAKSEIDQESLHRSEQILAQDEKERAELKSQNQQLIGQLTSLKSRAESAENLAAQLDAMRQELSRQSQDREREVHSLSERLRAMEDMLHKK